MAKGGNGGKGGKGVGGKGEGGFYGKGGAFGKSCGKGGFGKGGYGKAYNFDYYEEAAKKTAERKSWTLSMTKVKGPEFPPGLTQNFVSQNKWQVLENDETDEQKEQRKSDLAEMEETWNKHFPKMQMMNYSKSKIRKSHGEKKIKFESIRKRKAI